MNNDVIFIPGGEIESKSGPIELPEKYLTIAGSLREIAENDRQGLARYNLDVYSKDEVHDEINPLIEEIDIIKDNVKTISDQCTQNYENITQTQNEFIKKDGSTPFEAIQEGITPQGDSNENALTTIKYILKKLGSYSTTSKIDQKLQEKLAILENYALLSDVYKRKELYRKDEISALLKSYAKVDGSNKFIAPQEGSYPKVRTHLSTKGYVDDIIKQHKNEIDPHGFNAILNNKLGNYYKKGEVWTKSQTYSRSELLSIVDTLVANACENLIEQHINTTQHLEAQDVWEIIKQYSINRLISKEDLDEALLQTKEEIKELDPVWKTSGPVLTTVGFIEDNTELPETMSIQEVFDSIFYGSQLSISADKEVAIGDTTDVTICIHSGLNTEYIRYYENGELKQTFEKEDFADVCRTFQSGVITEDTELKVEVMFYNDFLKEETFLIKAIAPSFVGLLPEYKFANTITTDYLMDLEQSDQKNNSFIKISDNVGSFSFKYNFRDAELKRPFLVVPADYPELESMITPSQSFGPEAFNIIEGMPMMVKNTNVTKIYKIYAYKQALSSLSQEVTFKFKGV